jgi:hypothetical protein
MAELNSSAYLHLLVSETLRLRWFEGNELNLTCVNLAQRRFGRAKQCAGTLQRVATHEWKCSLPT